MTKERFFNFIQHPLSIHANDIEELEQIIEQFPYFQTARLIYTNHFTTKTVIYSMTN